MSAWIALLDRPAGDLCVAAGSLLLAAWHDADRRPHEAARRLDGRVLDAAGPAVRVSLLWPDRDRLPLFDDPAVVRARRRARAGVAPRAVSTLTVDSRHFAGSLWVPGPGQRREDDPFRGLGSPLLLDVDAGLLGAGPPLSGPAQERYAGAPWPAGGFGRARP